MILKLRRFFVNKKIIFPAIIIHRNISTNSTYFQKHFTIPTSTIIKTGQIVSRLGFGGYRINWNDDRHQTALEKAIKNGINVIDTSAHFELGESEEVIGKILNDTFKDGSVARKVFIILEIFCNKYINAVYTRFFSLIRLLYKF